MRTLPALLVLAVTGTTAGADTAVMRPPPAGARQIMDAKQVMRLAAIVRSTGYACQEGIFVAYKLPREADAQQFDVMCLGTGALSDRRMRHYMLQIQDDASLALESDHDTAIDQKKSLIKIRLRAIGAVVEREG